MLVLRLWQQPMECVCGEQEGCVEAEDDATSEGVSLTEEECGGSRRQEEKEEKEQERLLPCAVAVNANSCHYAEDIVEDHKGDVQCG